MKQHAKINRLIVLGLAFFLALAILLPGRSAAEIDPELYKHPKIESAICND
jgi:hypothetical protein